MKLGLVTYQLAKDWDIDTIIENCKETGFAGVELRTTHAHGVEVALGVSEREAVKAKFDESGIELGGLGSAFEFDSTESKVVRSNIEGTIEYAQLAADVGAPGIKVRPNRLHEDEGVPRESTLKQIGVSLRECGGKAAAMGVDIRLEVHGKETCEPSLIRKIMDYADHDSVGVCWNSNRQDMVNGSIDKNFELLADKIREVHINELWTDYPWRRLFELLNKRNYQGFCFAEIPENSEAVRLMHYYRALWLELTGSAK